MSTPNLKVYKTHPNIVLPTFATKQSACFDLACQLEGKANYSGFNAYNGSFTRPCSNGIITLCAHDRILVPTGLILDIPLGYSVRIHPRSGLSLKRGIVLANAEGVIDSDYVEELFLLVMNVSENNHLIENGERLAQGELVKQERYSIKETTVRPVLKSERNGGMGSTGTATPAVKVEEPPATKVEEPPSVVVVIDPTPVEAEPVKELENVSER